MNSFSLLPTLQELAAELQARDLFLVTAESCTGGLIAGACTDLAGSSHWFDRGLITYSNAAKAQMLGVPFALIERYGAVSEQVAQAMARGALACVQVDMTGLHSSATATKYVSLAVTGVAGPGGGSAQKPVGMVCFGFDVLGEKHTVTKYFLGDREMIRKQAVIFALSELLRLLKAGASANTPPNF